MLEKIKPFVLEVGEFLDTLCCSVSSKACRDKECIVINVSKEAKSTGERDIMCNVSVDGEPERFAGCYESKKVNKDITRMSFVLS